jgi:hypothetical protein
MSTRRSVLLSALLLSHTQVLFAGAWSYESFGNDMALDWAGDFGDEPTPTFVKHSLEAANTGKYIPSYIGQKIIAAAEVVAASLGRPCNDFPSDLLTTVGKHRDQLQQLSPMARSSVQAVLGPKSELRKDWAPHASNLSEWEKSVNGLLARLKPRSA